TQLQLHSRGQHQDEPQYQQTEAEQTGQSHRANVADEDDDRSPCWLQRGFTSSLVGCLGRRNRQIAEPTQLPAQEVAVRVVHRKRFFLSPLVKETSQYRRGLLVAF